MVFACKVSGAAVQGIAANAPRLKRGDLFWGNPMRSSWIMGKMIGRLCGKGLGLAGLVALVLALPGPTAYAEENELSKETMACLKCHDKESLEKTLDNQEKLSLHVSTSAFAASMHGKTDCEDCHSGLDAKTHGKEKASIASKREYSLSLQGLSLIHI